VAGFGSGLPSGVDAKAGRTGRRRRKMPGYKEASPGTKETLMRDAGMILRTIDNIRTELDALEREVKGMERYAFRLDDSEDDREGELIAEFEAGIQEAKDTVGDWYRPSGV
jgi:hypothetical protein